MYFLEWKLNIVGDGEDKVNLMKFIDVFNLGNSVMLFFFFYNINEFYLEVLLYCMFFRFEGLFMVFIEV